MSDLRSFHLDVRLLAMRENAKQGRDPTAADETLACLLTWARDHVAERRRRDLLPLRCLRRTKPQRLRQLNLILRERKRRAKIIGCSAFPNESYCMRETRGKYCRC